MSVLSVTETQQEADAFATPRLQEVPLTVTIERACELLNTSRKRLYELLASGELKSYARGRKRLITGASIVRHIESNVQEDYEPLCDSPYQPPRKRRPKGAKK